MKDLKQKLPIFITIALVGSLVGGISIAMAALNFSGTTITGDGSVIVDGANTISIGTSTATGITIGKNGVTTTFPGNISVFGSLIDGSGNKYSTSTGSGGGGDYFDASTYATTTVQAQINAAIAACGAAGGGTVLIPGTMGAGWWTSTIPANCQVQDMRKGVMSLYSNNTVNPTGLSGGLGIYINPCPFPSGNPVAGNAVGMYSEVCSDSTKTPIWGSNPLVTVLSGDDTAATGEEVDLNNQGVEVSDPSGQNGHPKNTLSLAVGGLGRATTMIYYTGQRFSDDYHDAGASNSWITGSPNVGAANITNAITGSGSSQTLAATGISLMPNQYCETKDSNAEKVLITAVNTTAGTITGTFLNSHTSGTNCLQYASQTGIDFGSSVFASGYPIMFGDMGLAFGNFKQTTYSLIAAKNAEEVVQYPLQMTSGDKLLINPIGNGGIEITSSTRVDGAITASGAISTDLAGLGTYQNLTTYSQFDSGNGAWTLYCTGNPTITANTGDVTDPTGTNTAEKYAAPGSLGCDNTAGGQYEVISPTPTIGKPYTASIWMRGAAGGESVTIGMDDGYTSSPITLANTWKRYTYTATPGSTITRGIEWWTSTPGATIYLWGAQLEQASITGVYAHTVASAVSGTGLISNGALSGGMIYPSAGIAVSTGNGWGSSIATGTSGATIPLLSMANTWTGAQSMPSLSGSVAATIAAGAAAGSSPTITCAASHVCDQISGVISLTTGSSPTTGPLLTVTTAARTNQPNCVFTLNLTAVPYTVPSGFVPTYSTTVATLNVGTALASSTAYTINYVCGGK
jgi:hypothetical protein